MIWDEVFPENFPVENDSVASPHYGPNYAMDETAFEVFYRKMARPLRAYILRVTCDSTLADDLLQESFCRFLHAPSLRKDENHMKGYLYKIATNLITDHWRQLKREQRWFPRTQSNEDRHTQKDVTSDRKDLGGNVILSCDMMRIFQRLKPLERALLWLAYVEGADHREIADTLKLKEKSIRVMLFRARHKLAGLLRRKGLGFEVKS